jgi:lysozyme
MNFPRTRPQQTEAQTRAILDAHDVTASVALLGVRGYYKNTMGRPGQNDRGIYDDAIFLVSPRIYLSFNANTDPSRTGRNTKINKGFALLATGVWWYKMGIHGIAANRPRKALVQAAPVTVNRDGGLVETGMFAINIHDGGTSSTSSEGCQTIPPSQWREFILSVEHELQFHQQEQIPYCLIET